MLTIAESLGTPDIPEIGQTIIYNNKEYILSEIDLHTKTAWLLPEDKKTSIEVDYNKCYIKHS